MWIKFATRQLRMDMRSREKLRKYMTIKWILLWQMTFYIANSIPPDKFSSCDYIYILIDKEMVNTTTILQCTYYSKELEEYLHLTYEHHWEEKFTDVIFTIIGFLKETFLILGTNIVWKKNHLFNLPMQKIINGNLIEYK